MQNSQNLKSQSGYCDQGPSQFIVARGHSIFSLTHLFCENMIYISFSSQVYRVTLIISQVYVEWPICDLHFNIYFAYYFFLGSTNPGIFVDPGSYYIKEICHILCFLFWASLYPSKNFFCLNVTYITIIFPYLFLYNYTNLSQLWCIRVIIMNKWKHLLKIFMQRALVWNMWLI